MLFCSISGVGLANTWPRSNNCGDEEMTWNSDMEQLLFLGVCQKQKEVLLFGERKALFLPLTYKQSKFSSSIYEAELQQKRFVKNEEDKKPKAQHTSESHFTTKTDDSYSNVTPQILSETQTGIPFSDNTEHSQNTPSNSTQPPCDLSEFIDELCSQLSWDDYFDDQTMSQLKACF